MPSKLKFLPNIPITLELLNPEGDYDFDLQMGQYQTVDGRSLVLPRQAVIALNLLEPLPGEEIGICYRVQPAGPPHWDIWLTPRTEKARAVRECPVFDAEKPSELSDQLSASIAHADHQNGLRAIRKSVRHAVTADPNPFDLGTGTDGPAIIPLLPALALENAPRKGKPMPIPWNVAFREVSAWVATELAGNNLQWGDDAQKSMVCTVLIAEVKAGRISQWERW